MHELEREKGEEEAYFYSKTAPEESPTWSRCCTPEHWKSEISFFFSLSRHTPCRIEILARFFSFFRRRQPIEDVMESSCCRGETRESSAASLAKEPIVEPFGQIGAGGQRQTDALSLSLDLDNKNTHLLLLLLSFLLRTTTTTSNNRFTPTTEASTRKTASSGGTAPRGKRPPRGSPTRSRSTRRRTCSTGSRTA